VSLLVNNALLNHFAPSIRTLYVDVHALRVRKHWTAYRDLAPLEEPPLDSALRPWIGGVASSEDAVALIGSELPPSRQFAFSMHPFKEWSDVAAMWAHRKRLCHEGPEPEQDEAMTRLREYLSNVRAEFDIRAPTLTIGHSEANWETGSKDEWWLECWVPETVFLNAARDIADGRCKQLDLQLQVEPTLVNDPYAPPSVKVTYGVLNVDKYVGGTVSGWVTGLSWEEQRCAAEAKLDAPVSAERKRLRKRPLSKGLELKRAITPLHSEIAQVGHAMRTGLTILVVITAIIALAQLF
jgi:hypothetical protein